jgi:hypothetical protein
MKEKRILGRSRLRSKDNTEVDLKELGCETEYLIYLVHDDVLSQDFLDSVISQLVNELLNLDSMSGVGAHGHPCTVTIL